MRELQLTRPDGMRFAPAAPSGVGVLVIAGSSGRIDAARAQLFAQHGALSESVRWFGGPGQAAGPWEIPIELFIDRVEDLARECDRIIVCGTSFGSEAALLTGAHSPSVSTVIGFAPSDVVWSAVTADGRITSHWTVDGEPLSAVPFLQSWRADQDPPSYLGLYRDSRSAAPLAAAEAGIPVERIADVVLVAGGDDQVWPSEAHARCIDARRQEHGLDTTLIIDERAGHRTVLPGEPTITGGVKMARGGSEAADRRLGRTAWRHIRPLLEPTT